MGCDWGNRFGVFIVVAARVARVEAEDAGGRLGAGLRQLKPDPGSESPEVESRTRHLFICADLD
jgi:hypothetical protein